MLVFEVGLVAPAGLLAGGVLLWLTRRWPPGPPACL